MTFSKKEYKTRTKKAQASLGDADALLIRSDANMRYFTGVDSGRLLLWRDGAEFWLNEVYLDRASSSYARPSGYEKDCIKKAIIEKGFKKVGVDDISLSDYTSMDANLRKLLVPSDVCEDLRKIKSTEEMKRLAEAGRIASDALRTVNESNVIGMTELRIAAMVEYRIRESGSERPPFSQGMLCLGGPNTRYPHAPSGNRKVRKGDLLLLDLGAVSDGYHSDMTRTLHMGDIFDKKQRLVDAVKQIKEEAIGMVELGGSISGLHEHITGRVEELGYKFAHLSGHGVGLDIHEKPSLGPDEEDVFQDGMVFTIEPGIYGKEFGARSEDTIALVKGRKKILTS